MFTQKRIISVLLSLMLVLSFSGVSYAEQDPKATGEEPVLTDIIQEDENLPETGQADLSNSESEQAGQAEEEAEETIPAKEEILPEEADQASDAVSEPEESIPYEAYEETEITASSTPIEALKNAPAADNDAFFTVDLNNGKVTDPAENKVPGGFRDMFGETYSESGLDEMSPSQREDQIAEMADESDLYTLTSTDGDTAEITSTYSTCRLIVDEGAVDEVQTFGAVQGTSYDGDLVLCYEDEASTSEAYDSLCGKYGDGNVLIDLPIRATSADLSFMYWHFNYMGFHRVAKDIETYGDKVTVAVLDSGITRNHYVFRDGRTVYQGYDFVNKDSNPADDYGHGTFVASIIAQSTNSNISILPIKVLDNNGAGNSWNTFLALEYANTKGADIANLSLGMNLLTLCGNATDAKAWLAKADTYLKKFKRPIVAAAGNDHVDIDQYYSWPAVSSYTIAVSAGRRTSSNGLDFDDEYSNYGSSIDYAAPGRYLYMAVYNTTNDYVWGNQGTSFAAPHITAAAALVMSNNSSLYSKSQVISALNTVTYDLNSDGKDKYFGYGCPRFTGSNFTVNKTTRNISKASVKVSSVVYTGAARKPVPVVKYGRARLTKGRDYKVTYSYNKNVGKGKITITGIGVRHTGKKVVTFRINPRGTKITKLTGKKNKLKVKWSKQAKKMSKTRITGYQVQIATNRAFTKNKRTITVKGYKKISKTIKKTKRKTRYYVRVRTYKTVKGVRYYSGWSTLWTVKTP